MQLTAFRFILTIIFFFSIGFSCQWLAQTGFLWLTFEQSYKKSEKNLFQSVLFDTQFASFQNRSLYIFVNKHNFERKSLGEEDNIYLHLSAINPNALANF